MDTWLKKPNKPGWWLWKERGETHPEKLLLVGSGNRYVVASDDEVSRAIGRKIDEDENYWEGTDCNGKYMPGVWQFEKGAE